MKGTINQVDEENQNVVIDGTSYPLASHVKPTYIKVGFCEYSMKDGEISFIKNVKQEKIFAVPKDNKRKGSLKVEIFNNLSNTEMTTALNEFSSNKEVKYTQTHVENGRWFACVFYE